MSWTLRIHEPSGETRKIAIQNQLTIGRNQSSQLVLKDPTVALEAACLYPDRPSPISYFWLKIPEHAPPAQLAGMAVREVQFPIGVPLRLGETQLLLEPTGQKHELPPTPANARPWLTRSESGRELLWMARKAAATPLSVYLSGETGTGKEVLAHLIHSWSDRKSGPFIPLHCGALPPTLVESELFGHVKGAFTGAIESRPGALMQAHQGTLFLDEIGDLPLEIQVKLLRFLENGEIKPVGSDRFCKANVRLICATHRSLLDLSHEGKFRKDLYFRLASIPLTIPSLRSRPEDIELLAREYAQRFQKTLSPGALLRLKAHRWPGNVRELRHCVERAASLSSSSAFLDPQAFSFLLTAENVRQQPELELGASVLSLHEMEKALLLKVLNLCHGNRRKSAEVLGVARSTLFEMLKRHHIQGPRAKSVLQDQKSGEKNVYNFPMRNPGI
ncbi:MAG: sigma-54 interaction domain-containing protein [Bdellovibrionia bacterium]